MWCLCCLLFFFLVPQMNDGVCLEFVRRHFCYRSEGTVRFRYLGSFVQHDLRDFESGLLIVYCSSTSHVFLYPIAVHGMCLVMPKPDFTNARTQVRKGLSYWHKAICITPPPYFLEQQYLHLTET